jgi:hypothetical protein
MVATEDSAGKGYLARFAAPLGRALAHGFRQALRRRAVDQHVGLSGLVASIVGGELWLRVDPSATFLLGAGSALLGSIALVLLVAPVSRERC